MREGKETGQTMIQLERLWSLVETHGAIEENVFLLLVINSETLFTQELYNVSLGNLLLMIILTFHF